MKVVCPSLENKEKAQKKKNNRYINNKRAYTAWKDNDTSFLPAALHKRRLK